MGYRSAFQANQVVPSYRDELNTFCRTVKTACPQWRGIKIQIRVVMILTLLFTVLHKRIKEAEDFFTMVRVVAKNLYSYVSLEKFLIHTEARFKSIFQKDLKNVQIELFFSG